MDHEYSLLLVIAALSGGHLHAQGFAELTANDVQATVFSNGLIGPSTPNGNGMEAPAGTGL